MKKAFTLVELLAVIVILAIVLVIAVPKIQNIVNDSKKETFTKDINSVITELKRVYQNEFAGALGTNTQTYTVTNGVWTNNGNTLNIFDGKKELTGSVTIDSDGNIKLALHNTNYCAVKLINSTKPDIINFKTSCGLPNTYQQVEYIESSGTQWINTNVYMKGLTSSVFIDCIVTRQEGSHLIFGSYAPSGNPRFAFDFYGLVNEYYYYYNTIYAAVNYESNTPNQRIKINMKPDKVLINNTLVASWEKTNFTTPLYLYVFASSSSSGASYKTKAKVFDFKIYDNNELVRNMVPCYRISDNVIGMYDLVNNVFYTNAGSGTFVKGSNV